MSRRYCLDTNVLIQAWNSYYSVELCPDYWDILDDMAQNDAVFCTREVKREIEKIDDALKEWAKNRPHLFREVSNEVQTHLRAILNEFPRLVDTTKDRSMADPWVIAHALAEGATVVTKEMPTPTGSARIKIPDVCERFSVRCIDDFQFVAEAGIRFSARRTPITSSSPGR